MKFWHAAALISIPALALLLAVFSSDDRSPASAGISPSIDPAHCVSWTATPTVSPSPDPTPPWMPFVVRLVCNDTGESVSDLHFLVARGTNEGQGHAGVPSGCPSPTISETQDPSGYERVDVDWGATCVDPGEAMYASFTLSCVTPTPGCVKPFIVCGHWSLLGEPVIPPSPAIWGIRACPSPTPTPTPTPPFPTPPCPAATAPPGGTCPPCPTAEPMVLAAPVVALSTCPPIQTPSPTPFVDIQGDATCDGSVDATDALAVLRMNAGLLLIPCVEFDGDVDCNLTTNAIDALKILRHNAALSVTQAEPCPDIGMPE